jgi:hypothetical protein
VVNRVGDVGLSLAIMLMFATFGTVSFAGRLRRRRPAPATKGALTAIGLLLLLGACGKSGQVPLQSWLGDAMEGPTPVSALIHAATMVTAGVYLDRPLARRSSTLTPARRLVVVIVGAVTLLFGAIVGCAKDDIKKVAGRLDDEPDRLHVAGGRARPGRLRVRDLHLLTHGFFKAGPVPRRRLGHARDERPGRHAPLRRAAQGHADHLRHVRLRLPGDHRRSRRSPASSPRTRSSRPRSTRAARRAGSSASPRCSAPGSPRST